jgi:hypothetical protein
MANLLSGIGKGIGNIFGGILGGRKKRSKGVADSSLARSVEEGQTTNALQQGQARIAPIAPAGMSKGGKVKGRSFSASKRADGIAVRGKTRGRMV